MTTSRDVGKELDVLQVQMNELQQLVQRMKDLGTNARHSATLLTPGATSAELTEETSDQGSLYYSGSFLTESGSYRWEPQQRSLPQLLGHDADKTAKVLAAIGQKQRLELLRTVLREPMTGAELVERLGMGTTGQLYHHLKALTGADLLVQEERGGTYSVPGHRVLPLLLLLAAVSDMLDASDYLDLTEARTHAGSYLGAAATAYDPHQLLWSVLDNCILEHKAGHCTNVGVFLHKEGSITVADNGRGIPVRALPQSEKPNVQAVLTELSHSTSSASYYAPGGEKGITMPVVNALSRKLFVEIRRDGSIYRQDYKHGIPQTGLMTVGMTSETGTSVTFLPDPELFPSPFNSHVIEAHAAELTAAYPGLQVHVTLS